MTPTIRAAALSAMVSVLVTVGVLAAFEARPGQPAPAAGAQTTVYAPSGEQEDAIISAIQKAEPAVVSVIITKDLPVMEQYYENVPGIGGFDIQIPRVRQNGTQERAIGGGTAFFVSDSGLLMTNKHVVSDAKASYTVLLNDGRKLPATVIAEDPAGDIALLKVDGKNFPTLELSQDDDITLGQTAIAIGNALAEFRNTVSVGVVSGLQRSIIAGGAGFGSERLDRIIQTDAAINEGNSGGPLLNSRGDVIGMNTAVSTTGQNIGFAIPVQDLRRALRSYAQNGKIVRPYIGVHYVAVDAALQKERKLNDDYGVLIASDNPAEPAIVPDSPAAKADLRTDDVILSVNGTKLDGTMSLADLILQYDPGTTITLKVRRGDQKLDVKVTLEAWKKSSS